MCIYTTYLSVDLAPPNIYGCSLRPVCPSSCYIVRWSVFLFCFFFVLRCLKWRNPQTKSTLNRFTFQHNKRVSTTFTTWHAHCKWNTWPVIADTQLSHTLTADALQENNQDLVIQRRTERSGKLQLTHSDKTPTIQSTKGSFLGLLWWTVIRSVLPKDCYFLHWGTSSCQYWISLFHFFPEPWREMNVHTVLLHQPLSSLHSIQCDEQDGNVSVSFIRSRLLPAFIVNLFSLHLTFIPYTTSSEDLRIHGFSYWKLVAGVITRCFGYYYITLTNFI